MATCNADKRHVSKASSIPMHALRWRAVQCTPVVQRTTCSAAVDYVQFWIIAATVATAAGRRFQAHVDVGSVVVDLAGARRVLVAAVVRCSEDTGAFGQDHVGF